MAHTGTVSLPNGKLDVQLKDTMCKKVEGIEEENKYIQKQTKCQNEVANYDTYYTYDLVPKGAHARGYALQLKIKHC